MSSTARPTWILPLAICTVANIADGYDTLAVAFAAAAIARDFRIGPATLGAIFSAGLIAMMLGSLLIAPLADRIGRRRVALLSAAAAAGGMLLSGVAASAAQLMAFRFVTGLGIGGLLAALNTIVAETAPPERRNLAVSIFMTGYPVGSVSGGMLAVALIEDYGWRSIFLAGGGATAAILVLMALLLAEPDVRRTASGGAAYLARLFGRGQRASTLLSAAAFVLMMGSFAFVMNWTPKLVADISGSEKLGLTASIVVNAAGLAGGLLYGVLADALGWRRVAQLYALGLAVSIASYGLFAATAFSALPLAALLGLLMAGAMTGLYAIAPRIYPAAIRAGGTGFAIGVGRIGSAVGAGLAGILLAAGIAPALTYLLFGLPPLAVALLVGRLREARDDQGG